MTGPFEIEPPPPDACAAVIANGPSLRGIEVGSLPALTTFGMNAAYRHWDRIGWYPTHYACLDEVVGLAHIDAIAGMIGLAGKGGPGSFLLRANLIEKLGELGQTPHVSNFDVIAAGSRSFGRTPVTTGSHTLIWAVSLGFKTVFLLGADCNYVEIVPGAERFSDKVLKIARSASNPNYYFDDYQRVGDLYHVPNIGGKTHLASWRSAASVAAEAGAVVYNLSPASRIDDFDFARIEDWTSGKGITIFPREQRRGEATIGDVGSADA